VPTAPASPTPPPPDPNWRPEPYRFRPLPPHAHTWTCLICHAMVAENDMRQHLVWHGITNSVMIEDFVAESLRLR